MWSGQLLLILGCILHASSLSWPCTQDSECAFTVGALCREGNCACPLGQQAVLGNSICASVAPYLSSSCREDHQCSRLVTNFECRGSNDTTEGNCFCRPGFHYTDGRCWQSSPYEGSCSRDEDCMGAIRDPFSLSCVNGQCGCAEGYYRRQWGECRLIGRVVGDGCVLNEDCQFQNGACNINTFRCYDVTVIEELQSEPEISKQEVSKLSPIDGARQVQHGAACDVTGTCPAPFTCASFGTCVCPRGYYGFDGDSNCYAELGSPATEGQCVGLFAEVRNGICTCQANFFFGEDMRDCVKVVRVPSDSCINDEMCHTFGASVTCAAGNLPWNLRSCQCLSEETVWDENRLMCRLFAGIGEPCRFNSDCLAGGIEIICDVQGDGEGVCVCPEGTTPVDGLCLRAGLELGDTCQASVECTGTSNSVCGDSVCVCDQGYQELNGRCIPTLGGTCTQDNECTFDNQVCFVAENSGTCQCRSGYVEHDVQCWPQVSDSAAVCNVTAQCVVTFGAHSECLDNRCVCLEGFHERDGRCWPRTGLFERCGRTSECFLNNISERVVCRNSMCQCSFDYPYSEELQTCTSAAATTIGSLFTILLALYYTMSN